MDCVPLSHSEGLRNAHTIPAGRQSCRPSACSQLSSYLKVFHWPRIAGGYLLNSNGSREFWPVRVVKQNEHLRVGGDHLVEATYLQSESTESEADGNLTLLLSSQERWHKKVTTPIARAGVLAIPRCQWCPQRGGVAFDLPLNEEKPPITQGEKGWRG